MKQGSYRIICSDCLEELRVRFFYEDNITNIEVDPCRRCLKECQEAYTKGEDDGYENGYDQGYNDGYKARDEE